MSRLPQVAGLILCKRMDVNPAKVEMSLVGVFHELKFSQWPTPVYPFTVYTEVHDAAAEGTMELRLTRLETEKDVYVQQRWFAASDRQLTFQLEWRVRKCAFPAPGRYRLSLQLDGEELSWRYLDVKAREITP